jgi:MoxR-like ATPase
MLKVLVDYPLHDDELTVVQRSLVDPPQLRQTLSVEDLRDVQRKVLDVYVDPALVSYAVTVADATRKPAEHGLADLSDYIDYGASPRGPISLIQSARALALMRGRDYVVGADVLELAKDALRHRLVLSYRALAEEANPDSILDRVLAAVPIPRIDLGRREQAA